MSEHIRFPGELEAMQQAIRAGEQYGYGNVIQALQFAWARSLKEKHGFDDANALVGGLVSEAWDNEPKQLTRTRAAELMRFGETVLRGL